jgi:AraC-like DNA-binding protein
LPDTHRLARGNLRSASADALDDCSDQRVYGCLNSPYHFAKQFKRATGLPPHQYVIARRVERAKQLLQGGDFTLAEVAARAGFSDQSQFCRHFKRLVGVTPGRFRTPTRIA